MKKRICSLLLALALTVGVAVPGIAVRAEDTGEKLIAFTFDDGPGAYTEKLIDGLDARGAKATFFMLGSNIANYPEAVKKMYASGHQLANHSWSHPDLRSLSYDAAKTEIMDTNAKLEEVDGETYHDLRCPYGESTSDVKSFVSKPIIYWSVDSEDWKSRNADAVYNTVMKWAYDGAIVLAHDIYDTSVDGMLRAVDTLQNQGYVFVTVKELLRRRGLEIKNGETYFDAQNNGTTLPAEVAEDVIGKAWIKNTGVLRSSTDGTATVSGVIPGKSLVSLLNTDDAKQYKVLSPWGEKGYLNTSNLVVLNDGDPIPAGDEKKDDIAVKAPTKPLKERAKVTACIDGYNTPEGGVTLCRLPAGSRVTVLEYTSDDVAMIKTSSETTAYVARKYLQAAPIGIGRPHRGQNRPGVEVQAPVSGAAVMDLNLRKLPSSSAVITTVVKKGSTLAVTEQSTGNWCKVTTADGFEGWVQTFFVGTTYTMATATADVNLRPAANTDQAALSLLKKGERVHILNSDVQGWHLILTPDLMAAYASSDFVKPDEATGA